MMTGTTNGESTSERTAARPGNRARARPIAAATPNDVERSAARTPAFRLIQVASIQARSPKYARYQRKDRRGGGNCRRVESLKDIGTTTSSGAIRKIAIRATPP